MGTFTLVGPGASVDRSQNNPLTFTWTTGYANEQLHRWRLQYRTVGSGTWLNAIIPAATNLLPNGSAESAITNWYASDVPFGYASALTRIAGGRHAGSGSWQVERSVTTQDTTNPGPRAHKAWHPGLAQLVVPVTPGGRYNFSGWVWTEALASGTPWTTASIVFYNTSGQPVGTSYSWSMRQVTGWNGAAAEQVAPAGAAYAIVGLEGYSNEWVGAKVRWDEFILQRVDNSSNNVAADTSSGNVWTYKYAGEPAGSGSTAPPVATAVLGPNFLAAGNWEFRIEAVTGGIGGAPATFYSNTVTSTMVTAAAAPTITTPATNGATVATNPANVVLTYASGQTQAQVRVMDGGTVKWDSGAVAVSGTTATISATFAENNVPRQIQARTSVSGVWSSWATRDVNVVWTPPATPTFTAAWEDTYSIGGAHAVRVTTTNPTPTGTQPVVQSVVVEWRFAGNTDMVRVAGSSGAGSAFLWQSAPNLALEVRVTAMGANGTSTTTSWQAVTGTPGIKGVVIYNSAIPSGVRMFRLNGDGASDDERVESALLAFSGREYPVVEFGAGTERTIEVPLLSLRTDVDATSLRNLLRARSTMVYRDKRGRAVLARMTVKAISDEFYGYTSGLVFDVIDSWGV